MAVEINSCDRRDALAADLLEVLDDRELGRRVLGRPDQGGPVVLLGPLQVAGDAVALGGG